MADNTFDIKEGSNQIVPNATEASQNIYIGDSAIQLAQQSEHAAIQGQILDMTSYSGTFPELAEEEIWRDVHVALCEDNLKNNTIVCVSGEEGVGMTTFLSQFARHHSNNCVSYFYNGFDRIRLSSEVMETDITEQLYWFATKNPCPSNVKHISDVYSKVMRGMRLSNSEYMYFVFDGFSTIPSELQENICKLIASLHWEKARFLFSGKKEQIEILFSQKKKISIAELPLPRFSEADANEYFRRTDPSLTKEQLFQLYKISRGNARRMNDLRTKYLSRDRIEDLMHTNFDADSDLNREDFDHICKDTDTATIPFFTLLAYAEMEFNADFASQVLEISVAEVTALARHHKDYVDIKDNSNLQLRSEGFRKYLCEKLQVHRRDIELAQIRVLEGMQVGDGYIQALPALYKSTGKTDELIKYLNADNVQRLLTQGHSQAALNVQCRFGYEACTQRPEKHHQHMFRFSLNKATSREIERNELWDHEISALIAVGHYVKAMALAQTVYLSEERLKCYLLIARHPDDLSPDDKAVLRDNIHQLVEEIDFEDIPDKSMELAKLLLPIDYEAAIGIVDRIAKAHKEDINTDKVFSQFSLFEPIDPEEDDARRDLARSKIQDNNLREFIDATKNLFKKDDVDTFLDALKRLPNFAQQLHLLRYWLPAHKDKENLGKAVLEALRLIVADSDMEMPKARILNDIARQMNVMDSQQMEEGLRFINSLGDTIMHPTSDYVDAMITVIEGSRNVLPKKSQELLEELYVFVDDLKDEGMWLTCTAKLLGHYDHLGETQMVSQTIGSKEDLRKELMAKANRLLSATAYHIKVVEGPIAALVCTEPQLIDQFIANVNTAERRSRAYSYAAEQYIRHIEPEKLDLNYFFTLLSKVEMEWDDCWKPLSMLTSKLISREKFNHAALLPFLKTHLRFLDKLDDICQQCTLSMRLYRWADLQFPDDPIVDVIKKKMMSWWESINQRQEKMEIGFHIAKLLARRSKEEAEKMIERCSELRRETQLSSSSCVEAFYDSLSLYVDSLITLISLGLCDDAILQAFKDDENRLASDSERASMWGRIALAYHLSGNSEKFRELGDQYLPTDYSVFTPDEQKWLIYHISPALYLRGQETFFKLLGNYDQVFRDACLKRVCMFVISKKLDVMELDIKSNYELSYSDLNDLNTLIEHVVDENILFQIIEVICRSLKVTNKKMSPLSTVQKNAVLGTTSSIVERKYPAPGGIRHDGYKIACQAIIKFASGSFPIQEKSVWASKLEAVDNLADRAFLYFYIAPFFGRNTDKEEFLRKGIEVTGQVNFAFDRVSRLDMALTECAINNLGALIPGVAEEALQSLKSDGTEEQYEGLLDTIHQYKPELAETIMVKLDQDPARVYNKRRLHNHLESVKRLAKAGKDMTSILYLDRDEQRKFFEERLKNLHNGKGQLQSVDDAFALTVEHLYNNDLSNAMPAIHYLLETVSQRQKLSGNCKDLLLGMHQAIRHNLRVVLSLASVTKERMEQVNTMFGSTPAVPDGFIGIGEYQKAVDYLLHWYQDCGYGELTIMDPHFHPSDLQIIKQMADQNNDLVIRILTHKNKFTADDFTTAWRTISTGVKTPIQIMLIGVEGKPSTGPLHDRYWICVDEDNDRRRGITLNSLNGMGKKESSIQPIDDNAAVFALYSYSRFAGKKTKKLNDTALIYEEFTLD